MLTKIAGNYKKAENEEACIKATSDAYVLMKKISGEHDPQAIRCWLNLAQVYTFFERQDDAKAIYKAFLDTFKAQGANWSQ